MNMHRILAIVWLAIAPAHGVLAEEGTANDAPDPGAISDGLKPGCFYAREVNNWDVLNRDYLIVYAPNKSRAYLVRISPPSPELRSAVAIAFTGRDRICGKAGESLRIGRGMGRAYMVLDVWQLDREAVDRMLDNKKQRDSGAIEAGESPGAAVETDVVQDDAD